MRQIGYGARNSAPKAGEPADELRIWRGYLCQEIERAHRCSAADYDVGQRIRDLAREIVRLARRSGYYTEAVPMLPCWECMHTWEAHHRPAPDHITGIPLELPCACRAGACLCVGYVDPLSCARCGCLWHAHHDSLGTCEECGECTGYARR